MRRFPKMSGLMNLKGPLQLQKFDQSLAGDVVFAAETYNQFHPKGLLSQRLMEGEGGEIILEDKVNRNVCAFDCSGFALAGGG